jgi:hypothetical protein
VRYAQRCFLIGAWHGVAGSYNLLPFEIDHQLKMIKRFIYVMKCYDCKNYAVYLSTYRGVLAPASAAAAIVHTRALTLTSPDHSRTDNCSKVIEVT